MRILKLGSDIWSDNFIRSVKENFRYKSIMEWRQNPSIADDKSLYYRSLENIAIGGCDWYGVLKDKPNILAQVKRFRHMIDNFDLQKMPKEIQKAPDIEHYYGYFPIRITDEGFFALYDGRHRMAIMVSRDMPIEVTVCSRHEQFAVLQHDLEQLYGGKQLYQPIPHPDFYDWSSGRDISIEPVLRHIVRDYGIKTALDCGCCHGYTLYCLQDLLYSAMALEYNEIRYRAANLVLNPYGYAVLNMDIRYYFTQEARRPSFLHDCILALSVLHHLMREEKQETFEALIRLMGTCARIFIYMLPEHEEEQYSWIYPEYRQDPYTKIFNLLGYTHQRIEQCGRRKLVVLS